MPPKRKLPSFVVEVPVPPRKRKPKSRDHVVGSSDPGPPLLKVDHRPVPSLGDNPSQGQPDHRTPMLEDNPNLLLLPEPVTPHCARVVNLSTLPTVLPEHLYPSLRAQRRCALASLQKLSQSEYPEGHSNTVAREQLCDLLMGTVTRGEGNSCLITGPRGSGKTQLVEGVLASLPVQPNVIRLSGHTQTSDNMAIREIAWQLSQQSGISLIPLGPDEEDNPFAEKVETEITLPPPAHLLALISVIPTLSRPTVVVLDAFDLFALHPRQSLLYCLFDTAQHAKAGANGKGLAVIGITPRVDTINLLEKRVKSRFSGRILRTAGLGNLSSWLELAHQALCPPITVQFSEQWTPLWEAAVNELTNDEAFIEVLSSLFTLTQNVRFLSRFLVSLVLEVTPSTPFPNVQMLSAREQITSSAPILQATYPTMCLLIAAMHAQTSGHDAFTFEMLHEAFCDQVRTSLSAPVQVEGGGVGMVRCSREVLIGAFEHLVSQKLLVAISAPAVGTAKEFIRYRCTIDRADVKQAVERMGQLSLKKWFNRAQQL